MATSFKKAAEILLYDYELRKARNPRYSKRAFASHLKISSGRLTDVLSGKSNLTEKSAAQIAKLLTVTSKEKSLFLRLVENEQHSRFDKRKKVKSQTSRRLQLEEFSVISDWEYFTLMALIESSCFKSDISWIAKKLDISETRTHEVIDRLIDLKYIQLDSHGVIKNTHNSLSTMTDIPSEILRKANVDCILMGIDRMNRTDIMHRDVTSLTIPVDPEKLKEVKQLIREFKLKVAGLMEGQTTTEVYNLNIQFIPISVVGI